MLTYYACNNCRIKCKVGIETIDKKIPPIYNQCGINIPEWEEIGSIAKNLAFVHNP